MIEFNQLLSEPETYGMLLEQIIKIQSHKIEKLEDEVYQAVTERNRLQVELDRLKQAYVFRHFDLFFLYGSLAIMLVVIILFGAGQ